MRYNWFGTCRNSVYKIGSGHVPWWEEYVNIQNSRVILTIWKSFIPLPAPADSTMPLTWWRAEAHWQVLSPNLLSLNYLFPFLVTLMLKVCSDLDYTWNLFITFYFVFNVNYASFIWQAELSVEAPCWVFSWILFEMTQKPHVVMRMKAKFSPIHRWQETDYACIWVFVKVGFGCCQ